MEKQNTELREIVNGFYELNLRLSAWLEKFEKREILGSVIYAEPEAEPEVEKYNFEEFRDATGK